MNINSSRFKFSQKSYEKLLKSNECKNTPHNEAIHKEEIHMFAIKLKSNLSNLNRRHPEITADKLNDIAIRIQKRINRANLAKDDIDRYRGEIKHILYSVSFCNDYNQDLEDYFKCTF